MKPSTLSALATLVLSTSSVSALTLYQDPTTGQVYTKGGEGRIEMGDFVETDKVYKEEEAKAVETKDKEPLDNGITIIRQDSPEFPLGKETHINMKFVPEDAPDMWLKAGVRIQGTFENEKVDYKDVSTQDVDLTDAYLRRVRFEIAAGFGHGASFVMDVRNDKSNYGIDNTEGDFNVGDAYVKIKKPFNTSLINFKLYRAKIDISRTETVKSARVIAYDRPYIADAAAQFISFNRRGTNAQMYGDWEKKVHYQVAMGDSASPDKVLDAGGVKGSSANVDMQDQSFFYGGKIRLSPFDGWEETKRTETYFGEGKHLSVGASYWKVPKLKGQANVGGNTADFDLNRELVNIEASGHYKGLFAQAEYFKFDDVVETYDVNGAVNTGTSSGWYATSEYVFTDFYYIAPFMRYEDWDRFDDKDGYDVTSKMAGINWYLRGNTTKVGIIYKEDEYGESTGDKDVETVRIVSQWFF